MSENIIVEGIKTNNLKNIDVEIVKNGINVIIGPSGSGKSSLAYDTIAEIGLHELDSMYSDNIHEPRYNVRSYKNIITSIPIKQMNNNNNVHSTIGTYFNLSQNLSVIFATILKKDYDFFVLNKKENICPACNGLGYIKDLDINRIVDYDKAIFEIPIKCWTRYKDFYRAILKDFCTDNGIDYNKKFRDLSEKEKKLILYGESSKKYTEKYKTVNRFASRTSHYYGVMLKKPMMVNFEPSSIFYTQIPCKECGGKKYSAEHKNYKIEGFSIGEVLCLTFNELLHWIERIKQNHNNENLHFSIKQIALFIKKAVELNLGYLSLNRIIPSLSGGELQRLRLVQVFNTQLTNLLVILDEPLAGLSKIEKPLVYQNIKELSKKHTLLIVDHHTVFFNDAANIIALGEKSGKLGGKIIDTKKYIQSQQKEFSLTVLPVKKMEHIKIKNSVYNYNGIDITIAEKRMNIISGSSGIGKSTLLREYFPQHFEKYAYMNQKSLSGNNHSFVATILDIFNPMLELFAKKFNKEKMFFSNISGADGACPICGGTGKLIYGTDFDDKISIICKDCSGTGFNKNLKKYKIQEKSIFDIWKMTIDEAVEYYAEQSQKITETLKKAQDILLGHLQIGQLTSTLSGGENIRIKILKSLKSSAEVYGIDEPFRGLNNFEMHKVATFLFNIVKNGKTVIVVDHEEEAFKYFSRHIALINESGWLVENEISRY